MASHNFPLGYVMRQALYSCITCTVDGEMAGVCLACSLTCHKGRVQTYYNYYCRAPFDF